MPSFSGYTGFSGHIMPTDRGGSGYSGYRAAAPKRKRARVCIVIKGQNGTALAVVPSRHPETEIKPKTFTVSYEFQPMSDQTAAAADNAELIRRAIDADLVEQLIGDHLFEPRTSYQNYLEIENRFLGSSIAANQRVYVNYNITSASDSLYCTPPTTSHGYRHREGANLEASLVPPEPTPEP